MVPVEPGPELRFGRERNQIDFHLRRKPRPKHLARLPELTTPIFMAEGFSIGPRWQAGESLRQLELTPKLDTLLLVQSGPPPRLLRDPRPE